MGKEALVWWISLVNTWYHFINPSSVATPERLGTAGPSGRPPWTSGLPLKGGNDAPHWSLRDDFTSTVTYLTSSPLASPTAAGPHQPPQYREQEKDLENIGTSIGKGENSKRSTGGQKIFIGIEREQEQGRENTFKTTVWEFNCREFSHALRSPSYVQISSAVNHKEASEFGFIPSPDPWCH